MAVFELVAVDGQLPEHKNAEELAPRDMERLAAVSADIQELLRGQQRMIAVLLAQQAQIEKLNAALLTVRISRAQEGALREAIHARARELAAREGMPETAWRKIASAIRTTLRETAGIRAAGELPSGQFDRAMEMVRTWQMAGALRKIRREMRGDAG